jgi:Ca2+-binding RTX toxin-like protein
MIVGAGSLAARKIQVGVLAACVLFLFALGGTAKGATLSGSPNSINFDAAAGEDNDLTIDRVGAVYRFTDAPGIVITPAGDCSAVGNVGTCPVAEVSDLRAFTDDLNDEIRVSSTIGPEVGFVFIGGGDGNDFLSSDAQGDTQMNGDDDFGTPGEDILVGGPASQTMIGGGDDDVMTANAGEDRLIIQEGNDILNAGVGDDLMDGGFAGGSDGPDRLSGGPGFDRVDMRSRNDDLVVDIDGVADDGAGCPGAGCEGDNVLPDVEDVSTGGGNDRLTGSPNPDRLNTEDGDDVMSGLAGADQMQSSGGDDQLFGGPGGDSLFGSDGGDLLSGGAGEDVFNYEFFDDDRDEFSGGGGIDSISGAGDEPVQVSLNGRADDGFRALLFTVPKDNVRGDIEDIEGSDGGDLLVGSSRPNEITANSGRDRIIGRGGRDGLIGGRGADRMVGGRGIDFISGGGGPDRIASRDGKRDEVRCGSALDRLRADRADSFDPDCDKVTLPRRRR